MDKKRKSDAARLDEVDRTLYTGFCGAANSLSQLYSLSMAQQKVAFQAGERHSLEKLCQWILMQHEQGSRVTTADVLAVIQEQMVNELNYGVDDASVFQRTQFPNQPLPQLNPHFVNSGVQTPSNLFLQASAGSVPRASHLEQGKNSVFSNALSSPVRRSLQSHHLAQGGGLYLNGALPTGSGGRNHEVNSSSLNRGSNSPRSSDTSMDMHPDSPRIA